MHLATVAAIFMVGLAEPGNTSAGKPVPVPFASGGGECLAWHTEPANTSWGSPLPVDAALVAVCLFGRCPLSPERWMTGALLAEAVTVPLQVGLVSWLPLCCSPFESIGRAEAMRSTRGGSVEAGM